MCDGLRQIGLSMIVNKKRNRLTAEKQRNFVLVNANLRFVLLSRVLSRVCDVIHLRNNS